VLRNLRRALYLRAKKTGSSFKARNVNVEGSRMREIRTSGLTRGR
jgi:hypothetical protein